MDTGTAQMKIDYSKIVKKEFDFIRSINSRWRDMDVIGHINNETLLSYFEDARVKYFSSLGFNINSSNASKSVILAGMKIDYLLQANYPDNYEVGCRIIRVGNKSFDLLSVIFKEGSDRPVVGGVFSIVCFDYIEQKTILVPNNVRGYLNPL